MILHNYTQASMKNILLDAYMAFFSLFVLTVASCHGKNKAPTNEAINAINLRRGEVVLCGPADKQFGSVECETSCSGKVKEDFNLAISQLHSFEYDEAEKVFAKNY